MSILFFAEWLLKHLRVSPVICPSHSESQSGSAAYFFSARLNSAHRHGVDKPQRRFQSECRCKTSTGCINKRRRFPNSNLAFNGVGGRQYGPGKVPSTSHIIRLHSAGIRWLEEGTLKHFRIPEFPSLVCPSAPLWPHLLLFETTAPWLTWSPAGRARGLGPERPC